MAVKETGDYVGYTESQENYGSPTLYFTDGRLTQKHKHADNVGWHPIQSGRIQYRNNITDEEYAAYKDARKNGTSRRTLSFIKDIVAGKYKEGKDAARLLEVTVENGEVVSYHPSRSKLIRRKSSEFNSSYGNVYAREQIKKAKVAAKESDTDYSVSYSPSKY